MEQFIAKNKDKIVQRGIKYFIVIEGKEYEIKPKLPTKAKLAPRPASHFHLFKPVQPKYRQPRMRAPPRERAPPRARAPPKIKEPIHPTLEKVSEYRRVKQLAKAIKHEKKARRQAKLRKAVEDAKAALEKTILDMRLKMQEQEQKVREQEERQLVLFNQQAIPVPPPLPGQAPAPAFPHHPNIGEAIVHSRPDARTHIIQTVPVGEIREYTEAKARLPVVQGKLEQAKQARATAREEAEQIRRENEAEREAIRLKHEEEKRKREEEYQAEVAATTEAEELKKRRGRLFGVTDTDKIKIRKEVIEKLGLKKYGLKKPQSTSMGQIIEALEANEPELKPVIEEYLKRTEEPTATSVKNDLVTVIEAARVLPKAEAEYEAAPLTPRREAAKRTTPGFALPGFPSYGPPPTGLFTGGPAGPKFQPPPPQTGQGNDNSENIAKYGLSNVDIERHLAPLKKQGFLGVFSSDNIASSVLPQIDRLKRPVLSFIFNSDPESKSGTHWMACYIDARHKEDNPNAQSVEYYDSFAEPPTAQTLRQLKSIVNKLVDSFGIDYDLKMKINGCVQQRATSYNCGWFAMKFLIDRYDDYPFVDCSGHSEIARSEKNIEEFKAKFKKFGYIYKGDPQTT